MSLIVSGLRNAELELKGIPEHSPRTGGRWTQRYEWCHIEGIRPAVINLEGEL